MTLYRRIPEQILTDLPDRAQAPDDWAEALTMYILIRLSLHTGFRSGTLRRLLVCPTSQPPASETELTAARRGELSWDAALGVWQLLVPATAFKNGDSRFFRHGPYRSNLPDTADLYSWLDQYIAAARPHRLRTSVARTLFVQSQRSGGTEFTQAGLYRLWRTAIERYGIYNPWTGRGAIAGLLPHGPHAVRAVIATHVLKATGSVEIAGYAIQNLPAVIEKHYGRYTPSDKARVVERLLGNIWD